MSSTGTGDDDVTRYPVLIKVCLLGLREADGVGVEDEVEDEVGVEDDSEVEDEVGAEDAVAVESLLAIVVVATVLDSREDDETLDDELLDDELLTELVVKETIVKDELGVGKLIEEIVGVLLALELELDDQSLLVVDMLDVLEEVTDFEDEDDIEDCAGLELQSPNPS
ncbi:hypothetical protein HBI51_178370 [Parastagonospora nodorum]|nr:hypothetical protein HBI00_000250 [Parastagonospora nodorum]KAH5633956.1 hypothetical protein HBI51_178370 [Parastagonospora nodorum]